MILRTSLITAFLFFSFSSPLYGQLDFAKWFNPGPLSEPHTTLEGVTNCTKCHATAKGVPDAKCLACHQEIQSLLSAKKGYHARQRQDCIACHGEHKGRNYDVTGLKRIQFDHAETGWPLTGGHEKVSCESCHTQKRTHVETKQPTSRITYLKASTTCSSCHADPHKSEKPEFKQCGNCHDTAKWKPAKSRLAFDHNKGTRYPLTGQHRKVACYGCHTKKEWAPLPFSNCTNCHADPHKGKLGTKCTKCHSTRSWGGITPGGQQSRDFDHDKTAFPLKGEHQGVTCTRCHGPVIGKMNNFQQCSGCHNNPHGDQFQILWDKKKECNDCHLEDGWTILSFRHNKDSRYELEDKHLLVPCEQCHVDRKYRWLPKSPDCVTCHFDVHRNQFEKPCVVCHTQKGFNVLQFDHNRDSPFPLVGKHQKVPCVKCHLEGRYKPLERSCQGCHNDFHKGDLGKECSRCHAPIAFNDIEFDHNREARFRLDGQHVKNKCNQCHVNFKYKFESFDCADCHRDVHTGKFGTQCGRCHSTQTFATKSGTGSSGGKEAQKEGFHDFGEFSLGGAHDRLECVTCHSPKEPVRGEPIQCASCHKDPHMNSLGTSCHTCHNQYAWLPSTFRHNQTGFELSGAHRFLSCDRCHVNRVFGGLPSECVFCHSKDFNASLPQHVGAPTTCEVCHFTFGFRPAPR